MIDSKWFLFTTNSAAVIKTLFEGIPFGFSVLAGCTFFYCVSSGFAVSNIIRVIFAIISVINLFAFAVLSNTFVRILLIKWERVFAEIRVAFSGAKVAFCSMIVGTSHFESFAAAVTHGVKIVRKSSANFGTCFLACFVTRLKTFDTFWHSHHLFQIIPYFGTKINIHDNPELLGGNDNG